MHGRAWHPKLYCIDSNQMLFDDKDQHASTHRGLRIGGKVCPQRLLCCKVHKRQTHPRNLPLTDRRWWVLKQFEWRDFVRHRPEICWNETWRPGTRDRNFPTFIKKGVLHFKRIKTSHYHVRPVCCTVLCPDQYFRNIKRLFNFANF